MKRRRFLRNSPLALGAFLLPAAHASTRLPDATASRLPRWRGFNLLEKYNLQWSNKPYAEEDFALIAEWGFDSERKDVAYEDFRGHKLDRRMLGLLQRY